MSTPGRLVEWRRQLGRAGVRGAIENATWLAGERMFRLVAGAAVAVWAARAFGPTVFGELSYALAFATLFAGAANLGTDGVVVRDIVKHPGRAEVILGTATTLRTLGAVVVVAAVTVAALLAHRHERTTLLLILVFGAATLFKPFEIVELWFQARTNLRPVVWARNVGFTVGLAARIAVLAGSGAVVAFAAADALAAAAAAALLVVAFRRHAPRVHLARWDPREARELLATSWPLLLSGLAIVVYMRIDQVMLAQLAGPAAAREVGLYAAALRLSEVWYFVPTAIVTAVFPHFVQSKNEGEAVYLGRIARLFGLMTALAVAIAVPVTLFARPLVTLVFGASYADAAPILMVHVWTTIFVFWGVVGEAWFVTEGLTRMSLARTLAAAALNVGLNLVLIPRYGGVGAAVATLAAQACAAWLFNLANVRTRPLFAIQARSLLLKGVFR